MNALLLIGTRTVVLALICYTVAIYLEQRLKLVTTSVLIPLTLGIMLDITATIFMILGSPNSPFTFHGFLGYSALAAMLVDTILIWRHRLTNDAGVLVARKIHLYSRYAYLWWVVAFITGALLVVLK